MGIVIHEADHSNRQPLFDEAYKIGTTSPSVYRPDLTGAARVAASVDLTMKAEVAGWYAELNTLRAEVEIGHVSKGRYNGYTGENTINGKLIAIELQGKAQGLSGNALTDYVAGHAKEAIPSSYAMRYTDAYTPAGVDKIEVRGILAYALDDPGQIKDFSEEVGPEGTYVSIATYNNGERITTVYGGAIDGHSEVKESLQINGTYRVVEKHVVRSYNSDGSFGDETVTQYLANGQAWRVSETDGARDNADYSTRITTYDAQGRIDSTDLRRDDGARDWTDYDQSNAQPWSRVESHFDAQGREDYARTFIDDGTWNFYDYDQTHARGDRTWLTHFDAQGRTDWSHVTQDDGSVDVTDHDQTNVRGDRTWHTHLDAQGRTDWTSVTQDDGSHDWTDYDQTNERGDRTWQTHTDAQGHTDWTYVTLDAGGHDWTDYDQANERGDSIWQNRTDAWGREDWANVTLDDGSRNWYDYDQDGTQPWSRVRSRFDAWGREDYADMAMDDGSRDRYDYDQEGVRGWARAMSHFDAWGREDYADMSMDDGTRDRYDYDQDGTQGWTRVMSHFDAWGREDEATVFMDNMRRTRYDYDQDNTKPWSRVEQYFNAAGYEASANVFNDDGSRTLIEYLDPGVRLVTTFNAAGLQMYREAIVDNAHHLPAPPPSFYGRPVESPFPPAYHDPFDPYPNADVEVGPLAPAW